MSSKRNWDRLSDMPDEILYHILSFLPTPECVRTSVLSSRWRHLWRCVPAFHFDIERPPSPGNHYEDEDKAVASEAAEKINQFIARRDAACPLLRFHLHIACYFDNQSDPVSDWISYARSHGVRDMSVHTLPMSNPPPLSTFFHLPSVEVLDLKHDDHNNISTLPQHIAPSKLKALTLDVPCACFTEEFLAALCSSCPDLQELTLYRGMFAQVIEITAPNRRRLTIIDNGCHYCPVAYQVKIICPRLEYLHLSNRGYLTRFRSKIPCLREASIDLPYTAPQTIKQFPQILMNLCSVTKLTFRLKAGVAVKSNPWCLEHMTSFPIFHKLKQLKFIVDLREDYIQQVFICFLGHSPNLSSLQVIHEPEFVINEYLLGISNGWQQRSRISVSTTALDQMKLVSTKGIDDGENLSDIFKKLSKYVVVTQT